MKRSQIQEIIREVLEELSTTGDAGAYLTPFAFSKKGAGKNNATKQGERLGLKTVKQKKRPYSTKLTDYLD